LAFEAKRLHVSSTLQPPVLEEDLRRRCMWFPSALPAELLALYGWHDGQPNEPSSEKFPFWFRDYGFSCVKNAQQDYRSMMGSYGRDPDVHELLKHSFPFAAFNNGWLVLTCKLRHPKSPYEHSIVSVMEGVDLFFYSMETMLETCIEWVSHPSYGTGLGELPRSVEMEIWNKHNPDIFKRHRT
jgi:hypothetical protein